MRKLIKIIIIIAVLVGLVIGITVLRNYLKDQTIAAPEEEVPEAVETVSGGAISGSAIAYTPTPTPSPTPTPTCTPLPEKVQIVREDNFFDNLISPLPKPSPQPEITVDDKVYKLINYDVADNLTTDTYRNTSTETNGVVETILSYVYFSETFSGKSDIPMRSDKDKVFSALKEKYSNAEYWLTMGITDVKIMESTIDYSLEITATYYSQPITKDSNIQVHSLIVADPDSVVVSSETETGDSYSIMKQFLVIHRILSTTNQSLLVTSGAINEN